MTRWRLSVGWQECRILGAAHKHEFTFLQTSSPSTPSRAHKEVTKGPEKCLSWFNPQGWEEQPLYTRGITLLLHLPYKTKALIQKGPGMKGHQTLLSW